MADTISNPLLSLIKEQGLIDDLQLDEVLQEQGRSGKSVGQLLNDFGIVETETQLQIVATHIGTEVVELTDDPIPPEVIALVPNTMARMYQCLPLEDYGSVLRVALGDPLNPAIVDELGFIVRKEVQVVVADQQVLERMINRYYPEEAASFGDALKELESEELADADGDAADLVNQAPIVRFVNLIIFQAVQDRASDIHFEPFEDEFKIRYRVDGALYEMAPPPKHLALPVISRIKIMANLNISERRLPQDGRISLPINGKQIDLRVSTLPTQFGESVVLRVLDRSAVNLDLETLGLPKYLNDYINEAILQPNGIFIVTGPTGSGKTTTLYSCLRKVNSPDLKLLTAEDPVEYDIEGIMQVAINDAVGMTFGKALRAFLRQDPDIIMVGEMRDLETSQIAIQASLTGHLVLSTLHTNDSAGAVTRLVDMGVEPFLVAATLEGVLAQRLVRTICKECRVPYTPNPIVLNQLGLSQSDIGTKNFFTGGGCGTCGGSGYKGRKGL